MKHPCPATQRLTLRRATRDAVIGHIAVEYLTRVGKSPSALIHPPAHVLRNAINTPMPLHCEQSANKSRAFPRHGRTAQLIGITNFPPINVDKRATTVFRLGRDYRPDSAVRIPRNSTRRSTLQTADDRELLHSFGANHEYGATRRCAMNREGDGEGAYRGFAKTNGRPNRFTFNLIIVGKRVIVWRRFFNSLLGPQG